MAKISWKSGTMISPLPAALISCGTVENPNVMTVSWTGIINSEPTITYVSIRPSRYSHEIISKTGEFVINLSTYALVEATDYCGVKSGRDENKFEKMNLTPAKCQHVSAPQVQESPVSIECRVIEVKKYGTHDMFIAEVLGVNVDDSLVDEDGRLALEKAGIISYVHGEYYTLGRKIGAFGFSVNKKRLAKAEKTKEDAKKEREEAKQEGVEPKKREYVRRDGGFKRERTGERSSERREGGYKRRDSDGDSRGGRSFEKRDGGFRRERTEGTGERSSERREGGRSFERRDGDSRGGRSFEKRDGGFRRERTEGTGERSSERREGGRSFEKRDGGFRRERTEGTGERSSERREGGRSFERRDGDSRGGRSFEKRDGGFRRERTEGTGERSSERREGGRSFERRDGDSRGGRSFEKRDGGFRRERTEGTGERSSERREGGRSFEKRDGDSRGGRSFEKRDGFKRNDSEKPRERSEKPSGERVQKKKYGSINKTKRESNHEKGDK